ncbi:hypothetical protein KY285_007856 [Solanum tuberosum]|nr:hypothetical protein KY289_008251 [Solanum tuberosum]KAH0746199.1 hypothetical protein KY285_007856 [Solanum tuberosum]
MVEGSKEGFKDGGRVHGKGLRKGSRTLEESTGWCKSPWSVNTSLNPSLVENILRQWSKEGFRDGARVHGNGLRKGSRTVEESTISEPILEPNPCAN